MAIGLQNFDNIEPADSDFPDGQIKDKSGSVHGTPMNKKTFGDIFQNFAKLLRRVGIVANGLPDSEYTGFQYIQALGRYIGISKKVYLGFSVSALGNCTASLVGGQRARLTPAGLSVTFEVAGTVTTGSSNYSLKVTLPTAIKMKQSVSVGGVNVMTGMFTRKRSSGADVDVMTDLSDSGEILLRANSSGDIEIYDTTGNLSSGESYAFFVNITGDHIDQVD